MDAVHPNTPAAKPVPVRSCSSKIASSSPISITAVLVLLAGMLLRLYASTFQLWLDEIWALDASRTINSLSGLFSSSLLNGHFSLYTLWLGLFPSETDPLVLRAPSLLCAGIQLYATWQIANRWWGPRTALAALSASAASFFFLVYATEARSYAVVGAIGPLLLLVAERYHQRCNIASAMIFTALFALGTLFHLSIVPFYVMIGLYSLITMLSKYGFLRGTWNTLGLHALPLGFFCALYATKLRGLGEGSGPVMEYSDVVIDSLSLVAGGPLVSPESPGQTACAAVIALIVLALLGHALWRLVCEREPRAVLLVGITIGIPVLVMATAPKIILPRYFYLSLLGTILVLSRELVRMWERNPSRSVARGYALMLAAAIICGNVFSSLRFLRDQRGDLRGAIAAACKLGTEAAVRVSGNHKFRDESMLSFFAPKVCARAVIYLPLAEAEHVDAMLVQSQDTGYSPRSELTHRGRRYSLAAQYPYAGLSGWSWYLYVQSPRQ